MTRTFLKMNGAGNDFVIFDARKQPLSLTPEQVKHLAGRGNGETMGCDQLIVMEPSKKADIFMRIYNADGSEVSSCGNASRCVGWLIMKELGKSRCMIETAAGVLEASRAEDAVRVDMGEPSFDWREIPLSQKQDTLNLDLQVSNWVKPVAVSMGNPHVVFMVTEVMAVPLRQIGPELEHHPLFPQRVNVSFAQPVDESLIFLRVWERGAGETLACGTAACATLVALNKRGLAGDAVDVRLPGGTLHIEWDRKTNHVFMTGPVVMEFEGKAAL